MTAKDKKSFKKRGSKVEADIVELTEDLKRIQADFVNFKRRAEEDQIRAANSGRQDLMRELLPVIDNIERALNNVPKDLEKNEYVKGVGAVSKQLQDALKKAGVERIKTKGLNFDPETMNAVSIEEGKGSTEVVVEELQPGYIMNGYIIRHAMVKVGRK